MNFVSDQINKYCEEFSEEESELLKELNRNTHLKLQGSRMLSGHLQGRFLSMISKLIEPKNILEIGTYSGYSALCLAEGLHQEGKLITIDNNEETNLFAKSFFTQSKFNHQIELKEGNALEIIPQLKNVFDLIFIDADKKNYSNYFDLVIDKIKPSGIIIADNVLWSGKILEEKKDADTQAIHQFNKKINRDTRVENVLLPIRDGLMVMRRM